jgi:hypothetical protein
MEVNDLVQRASIEWDRFADFPSPPQAEASPVHSIGKIFLPAPFKPECTNLRAPPARQIRQLWLPNPRDHPTKGTTVPVVWLSSAAAKIS